MDDRARARRRLRRLAVVLCAAPVLLVGGLAGWLWLREHSWTPPPIPAPSPLPKGFALRVAAAKLISEDPYTKATMHQRVLPVDPADDPLLPVMRETSALNQKALVQLKAALDEPCWVPASEPGAVSTQWARLRSAARELAMESRLKQADRDWPGAAEPALIGIQLGLDLCRGSELIAMLVGEAIVSVDARPLWPVAAHLTADQARAVAARLERLLDGEPTAAQQMRWYAPADARWPALPRTWERKDVQVAGRRLTAPVREEPAIADEFADGIGLPLAQLVRLPSPRVRHAQAMRWLNAVAVELDKPYAEQRKPSAAGAEWVVERLGFVWRSRCRYPDRRAARRLLLANTALRGYRAEHGAYPARLDDLVPGYLKHVPVDPFDLRPLRYRRQGDSYRCWSVGPDGKDDGARRIVRNKKDSPAVGLYAQDGDVGDIVTP